MKVLTVNNRVVSKLLRESYTVEDLERVREFFETRNTLRFFRKGNGLYAALSTGKAESVSGYTYAWVRDIVMVMNYLRELGQYDLAVGTLRTLRDYFYKHRSRFTDMIEGKADRNIPRLRPHVRFNSETLEEVVQKWAHAQNDALGYALWMAFRLANEGAYLPDERDAAVYSLFPPYFDAIEYWSDRDSGHWEEDRKINTSSIGVVAAALEEMEKFIEGRPSVSFRYAGREDPAERVRHLIERGREHLQRTLPYESPPLRKEDAALLFLVYPLETVVGELAEEVTSAVRSRLKGDYGIKRYEGDSFFCADYTKLFGEKERTEDFSDRIEERNRVMKPGTEAQWCLFDPVISVYYGKRYLATGEESLLDLQTYHFNRSLGQLTPEDFPLGGGQCPELYFIEDSSKGIYVPNDQTPLAWTQANLGVAFKYMRISALRRTA
ncbi:MAG: phosphorylase kinase [Alphaproteobacteria bacterium]|uniref:Phosphorylase kinase n=1 Tax=Candidatus Nitrobium versatile TaxID=2884831 RepID=A0A953J9M9_9BACT|nr:phosphorylase kinase [Candidatus Nitrobium versatile]